jgi:hypothetical protein
MRAVIGSLPDDPLLVSGVSDGTSLVLEATFPARIIAAFAMQK